MTQSDMRPDLSPIDDEVLEDAHAERRAAQLQVLGVIFAIVAATSLWILYRGDEVEKETRRFDAVAPQDAPRAELEAPIVRFREVAEELGLNFVHDNGAQGQRLLPETMGAGCGFIDFDDDGDQDVVLVQSGPWDARQGKGQGFFVNEGGRFRDASAEVGLAVPFYGMGVAVGDYDDDGRPDLYFTAVGRNRLFRNVDGRRFEDVTEAAGVGGGDDWSTGAVFFDPDRDGDLDLFVLNYVRWSPEIDLRQTFSLGSLARAYGPPNGFEGAQPYYFRNEGEGRFKEVAAESGLHVVNPATGWPVPKSLGVVICDVENDGWLDLVVANDTVQNFLFKNLGNGRFEEIGADVGIAFAEGKARGAMGIDAAAFANDRRLAVAIGNFANEMSAFYVNEDAEYPTFVDDATTVGIGAPTRERLTFGLSFLDYDLDGYLDLAATNGHVEPEIARVQSSQSHAQPMDLFWNASASGRARFVLASADQSGPDLHRPFVGRGLAVGDVDGDGDLDLLATENGGRARLFLNDVSGKRSLRLSLRTRPRGRAAIGALVRLRTSAGDQWRRVGAGGSYLSVNERVLTFGLGDDKAVVKVSILWPNGVVQEIDNLDAGYHELVKPR